MSEEDSKKEKRGRTKSKCHQVRNRKGPEADMESEHLIRSEEYPGLQTSKIKCKEHYTNLGRGNRHLLILKIRIRKMLVE